MDPRWSYASTMLIQDPIRLRTKIFIVLKKEDKLATSNGREMPQEYDNKERRRNKKT